MKRPMVWTIVCLVGSRLYAGAVPSAFTYQGALKQSGIPASGIHHLTFRLTDINGAAQYGSSVDLPSVTVNQGLFAVQLDFTANGATPIDWQNISPYVQVSVDGQALSPNEPLTSTVYSLMSAHVVDGAVGPTALIGGVYPAITGLGAQTQALNMNGNGINNIAAPGVATDAANKQYVDSVASGISPYLIPPGTIVAFAGRNPPSGWDLCNGQAVPRTGVYANLFSAIGVTWGAGDNVSTFNLPDLRGRVPMGTGQGVGLTNRNLADVTGSETHHLIQPELPSYSLPITDPGHVHGITDPGHSHGTPSGGNFYGSGWTTGGGGLGTGFSDAPFRAGPTTASSPTNITISNGKTNITVGSGGSDVSFDILQPSLAVNYIIKE